MPKKLALCVRLSSLGDIINTFPSVKLLADEYNIHFLTESRFKDLVEGNPLFEKVHILPLPDIRSKIINPFNWVSIFRELVQFAGSIRKYRYDCVFDFHSSLKSVLGVMFVKSPVKKGYDKGDCYEFAHIFYNEKVSTGGKLLHRQEKFARLVSGNGHIPSQIILPAIKMESIRRAKRFLDKEGLKADGYVVVHPGTSRRGHGKRWASGNWSKLILGISEKYGLKTVLTWGKNEYRLVEEISNATGQASVIAPLTETIHDLRALIRMSKVFISCDTGPLHISCADGNNSVGLFGPKDPRVYAPRGENFRLVHSKSCSMADISVEQVLKQVIPNSEADPAPARRGRAGN